MNREHAISEAMADFARQLDARRPLVVRAARGPDLVIGPDDPSEFLMVQLALTIDRRWPDMAIFARETNQLVAIIGMRQDHIFFKVIPNSKEEDPDVRRN